MLRTLLIALLVLSPACSKDRTAKPAADKPTATEAIADREAADEKASPEAASQPISDLGDVVATLQLPSGNSLGDLAQVIDNIKPGASAQLGAQLPLLLAQVVGVDLSGADLAAAVSVLVLNPKQISEPVVVLVKARDKAALESSAKAAGRSMVSDKGLALIGSPAAVESARSFAFAHLAKPSSELLGTVYPTPLARAFRGDVDRAIAEMSRSVSAAGMGPAVQTMIDIYREMFVGLGEQTDRAIIRVGTAGASSELYLSLYAKPGTTLEGFTAAQVPALHELLEKLPARSSASMLFSGRMHAGPTMDALSEFAARAMTLMLGEAKGAELGKLLPAWLAAFDGKVAMAMDMKMDMSKGGKPNLKASYLMGSNDAVAMRKGWRGMMKLMSGGTQGGKSTAMMGMKFDIEFKEKAMEIDGVEVDYYSSKMDLASVDASMRAAMEAVNVEQKMYFAAFDSFAAMSMASDSPVAMKQLIDSARGNAPGYQPSPALAKALERSKKRRESMLLTMDIGALAPAGAPIPFQFVVMGLGQRDGALVMRLAIGQ